MNVSKMVQVSKPDPYNKWSVLHLETGETYDVPVADPWDALYLVLLDVLQDRQYELYTEKETDRCLYLESDYCTLGVKL